MKQVFLSGKGQVDVLDVPIPGRLRGGVLVRNAYSLISAGTEGAAVTRNSGARGLYEKAMNSRDRLGQVWSVVQSQGLNSAVSLVQNKLGDHTPIGYSSAGVVLEADSDNLGFEAGQRVACMGAGFANHAEFVTVPKNLVARLPDGVEFEQAAFSALACIAMQGIRRLELSPGESVAVVGLGLIGQIALRLATAMGYQAYGFDINDQRVATGQKHLLAIAVNNSKTVDPATFIQDHTSGVGVDGIVICASSSDDVIVNQAFEMCRRRGRVSVVGDIGLGLERAKMYAKELEVRLSCSYGAGRYDPEYELGGHDYPLAYARWTERRNLDYFLMLLASGRLNLSDLISQKFHVADSHQAFSAIKSGDASIYGVILDHGLPEQPVMPALAYTTPTGVKPLPSDHIKIGVVGVGAYAKNIHLPNLRKLRDVTVHAVGSRSGGSAAVAARKYGAVYATSDANEIFTDEDIDAVVISTRHSSHASLAIEALKAEKHVFIEKPMAITTADCLRIINLQQASQSIVRVGFNRRFAPMLQEMKRCVGPGRKILNMRINVGPVDQHWSNTASEGGRLLGEGVHFFDLANWLVDGEPASVSAQFMGEPGVLNADASVTIGYANGSVANICYVTQGHVGRGKEFFELFANKRSAVVDDYKTIRVYGSQSRKFRVQRNNKGQMGAMAEFISTVRGGKPDDGADAVAGLLATAIAEAAVLGAKEQRSVSIENFIATHGDF